MELTVCAGQQSPDTNMIENVWLLFKRKLQTRTGMIKSKNDLMREIHSIWTCITPAYIQCLLTQVNSKKDIKCNQAQRTPHKILNGKSPLLLHFARSFIYSTHLDFATFVFKRKYAAIVTEYFLHVSIYRN